MASVTGIVNSALLKVGARKQIVALNEGSSNANVANALYEPIRDALLRSHAWNFAVKRQKLAQSSTQPTFEFDYCHRVPTDWCRTLHVTNTEAGRAIIEYRIEGPFIKSNSTDIWLKYVSLVEDPNLMTPDFRETLSLALAVEFALPVANSGTMRDRLKNDLSKSLRRVRGNDAIEDFPDRFPDGSWVTHRQNSEDESNSFDW